MPDPAGGPCHSLTGSERHWLMQNSGCLLETWAENTRTNLVLDTTLYIIMNILYIYK